jgi:hypothetical protein
MCPVKGKKTVGKKYKPRSIQADNCLIGLSMAKLAVYGGSAMRYGMVGAAAGVALGIYSAYTNEQRRTTRHLGLDCDLGYLESYDEVVYALSCLRDRSRVPIADLARALNELAELAVRVDTEEYIGHLKIHAARKTGQITGLLGEISQTHGGSADPDFNEHLLTIETFADDTRHNVALM